MHQAQTQILNEAKRFNVIACGRRFGKDTLAMNLYAETGLEGFPAAWFTPTYKMLSETFQYVARTLKPVASRINGSEHRIELITGGVLDMWSLDSQDTARGRKYKRAIINEAAFVPNLLDAWNFVIRPTLADYKGDGWFLGTPKGHNGFWQFYNKGIDDQSKVWKAWQKSTFENPYIDPNEIEAMREAMPERAYQQEILAVFTDDGGGVFRNVRACCTASPDIPENHKEHHIVMGGDWGQSNDFTALGAYCVTCNREVEIDRFNQISWAVQRARVRGMYERWSAHANVSQILLELNSIGSPNVEALQMEGLPVVGFETTAQSKPQLVQSLVLALEKKERTFINDPVTIGELEAYEEKRSTITGRPQYSAPEGMHDDTCIRACLENWAITNQQWLLA
jgi:hypothetical protein